MAKASWLTTNPTSGSGNKTISNTGSVHTGRETRSTTVTVTAVGVSSPVTYAVTQEAKAEYVSFDNGSEMAADKAAGTVTITGKTNSKSLTFAFVGDSVDVSLPASYTANGKSTSNGAAVSGDPGATAEYAFSIALEIPLNDTISEVTRTLKVTPAGGTSLAKQIAVKQAAGDARISVEPESITLTAAGTAVSVTVNSNTSWSIS
jgi:phage baseplate assembly protein gpV